MAPALEERFYETQRAQLLRWLPWLQLFRAFRIALEGRKILLGTLAAVALTAGDSFIDTLPFMPNPARIEDTSRAAETGIPWRLSAGIDFDWNFASDPSGPVPKWSQILSPLRSVVDPGSRLFQRGNSWADAAYYWTQLLFRLTVWSLLGGAIARMAAVQFASRESVTARAAVRYSAARFGSMIGAPLLPLVFIGFFWIVCLLLGLVGRIPGVGPSIVGALWFLPLVIGIALAVILLVIAVSWPLMVATISTEGTDAFDGLSRGYDYVLNRTWYALWLLILAVAYGTVVLMFVEFVANYAVDLAYWSVGSGIGNERLMELATAGSLPLGNSTRIVSAGSHGFASTATSFWLRGLLWLLQGYVISYFWTAVTIIYFLLRLSLDAKPLDQVYVPSAERKRELPLVGMAASERRDEARRNAAAESPGTATDGDSPGQTAG